MVDVITKLVRKKVVVIEGKVLTNLDGSYITHHELEGAKFLAERAALHFKKDIYIVNERGELQLIIEHKKLAEVAIPPLEIPIKIEEFETVVWE